jgi:hypothetical protein
VTGSPLRHWSAWIPLAIPVLMLLLALRHVLLFGVTREADEGTEAHLFQLLMPVALIGALWFAATWIPRAPRQAALIFALQAVAIASVFGFVYWMEHQPV